MLPANRQYNRRWQPRTGAVIFGLAEAAACKLQLELLQEAAVVLDRLPAVIRLTRRVDQALQIDAECARRLKCQMLPLHLRPSDKA